MGALVVLNLTSGSAAVLGVGACRARAARGFAGSGLRELHGSGTIGGKLFRHRRGIFAGCVLFAIANMATIYGVRPTIVKDALEAPGDLAFDRWNSSSRITVGQSYLGPAAMWGPSPRFPVPTVEQ